MLRDSDGTRSAEAKAPVPKDCQARADRHRPSFDDLMAAETRMRIKFNQFLDGLGK